MTRLVMSFGLPHGLPPAFHRPRHCRRDCRRKAREMSVDFLICPPPYDRTAPGLIFSDGIANRRENIISSHFLCRFLAEGPNCRIFALSGPIDAPFMKARQSGFAFRGGGRLDRRSLEHAQRVRRGMRPEPMPALRNGCAPPLVRILFVGDDPIERGQVKVRATRRNPPAPLITRHT